tara:strand:+ start:871 stop:1155 length:285 start_codon:yes stop_codon:yes gene_type:complete
MGLHVYSDKDKELHIDDVSKPLEVDCMTINPIDKDGDFEVEMLDEHTYLSKTQSQQLIDYLTKSINVSKCCKCGKNEAKGKTNQCDSCLLDGII